MRLFFVVDSLGRHKRIETLIGQLETFGRRRRANNLPPANLQALDDELNPRAAGLFGGGNPTPVTLDHYDRKTDLSPAHYNLSVSRKTPRK